ncbi:MAG: class I tRNA ligase family protein [Erysipelotrichaceae bacterium]|nr:class I tRNA ligase family protein [Erysipelotrichaceae bacterium]
MSRPEFPKRAVITAGMPYGNKDLHFGHIGGVFVHADVFARFLRDRIGKENVIFVSGTDCYGSPIAEGYRKKVENEGFTGTIEDYVMANHLSQKKALDDYEISLNIFGASGLLDSKDIHQQYTNEFITTLYKNGWLEKLVTKQFYDTKANCFLNGRQVIGKCPIENCQSEKGYADECDLGHQYMPEDLIDPKSTLTGETPEMRDVTNWYFRLTDCNDILKEYVDDISRKENVRRVVTETMRESLAEPIIYVRKEGLERYRELVSQLPEHQCSDLENIKGGSFEITFRTLKDREEACTVLTANGLRYRTGKTLVPLRLTGNIEWGVKAPSLEGEEGLTVWVWPESLWAPISFTKTFLKRMGKDDEAWKDFWCDPEAGVFQFIGQDNIYFYGVAQMPMFMAQNGSELNVHPGKGELCLPTLVANHHILFLDKKASSSGSVKPPMAADLLNYYTAEQLRAHFISLALANKSVSFMPKPLNPQMADSTEADPVLAQGNLFTNVLNRLIRSCFYCAQKYYDGTVPYGEVSREIRETGEKAILDFERQMYRFELHQLMNTLDTYIRQANKYWARNMNQADKEDNEELRRQTLIDCFHMVRVATLLSHAIVPKGCEKTAEYLNADERFFDWNYAFEDLYCFFEDRENHRIRELREKEDFFTKHPSQFTVKEG